MDKVYVHGDDSGYIHVYDISTEEKEADFVASLVRGHIEELKKYAKGRREVLPLDFKEEEIPLMPKSMQADARIKVMAHKQIEFRKREVQPQIERAQAVLDSGDVAKMKDLLKSGAELVLHNGRGFGISLVSVPTKDGVIFPSHVKNEG